MVGSVRAALLALAALALATRAHLTSHDDILRVQLWDAEGLSREPLSTPTHPPPKLRKTKVDSDALYKTMLDEFGAEFGRFTRHKVRHKRRHPRDSGGEPWRFHSGNALLNVAVYDGDVPWDVIEGAASGVVRDSAVSGSSDSSGSSADRPSEPRDVAPPSPLRYEEEEQIKTSSTKVVVTAPCYVPLKTLGIFTHPIPIPDNDSCQTVIGKLDEEVKKQLPVVPKCCASGQNLTLTFENGKVKSTCTRSSLTFQPVFHKSNETHLWSFDSNVFETIVGNPCKYDRYRLSPEINDVDEFYLLVNGSLFVPYSNPYMLGTKDFCMETFYNESYPAGLTLPLVCFQNNDQAQTSSATLIVYATGLLVSVPFLLATAAVYLFIRELRDTHGKALACHSICLAVAFSCLATTQLAGSAFPRTACTTIAYIIQFSFVSCFFWLNVMCFDTFLNIRRYINSSVSRRSMRRRFAWYCAYAILLPLTLLIVTITMQLHPAVPSTYLKPNFGVKACWFQTDQAALPYFYGPVAVILLSNLIIFFFTSQAFALHYNKLKDVTPLDMTHSDFSTTDDWVRLGVVLGQPIPAHERSASPPTENPINFNERLKKYRKIFRTSCMLSFIMGLSWVLEVVSWAAGGGSEVVSVWSVFDLINALQGVVIFAIYVLQQPVRSQVKNSRLFCLCKRSSEGSEVAVVSERNSIDCGNTVNGRRDYV